MRHVLNSRSTRRRPPAFTLVELLVVIGIIAALIGILLPTLSRAREKAKQVQCQSNLRDIGAQLLIYAQKWNGWIIPPGRGFEAVSYTHLTLPTILRV